MLHSVSEQLAYDHLADLRRDAAAHSRASARADRAGGRARHAHAAGWAGLRLGSRSATAVGCEA